MEKLRMWFMLFFAALSRETQRPGRCSASSQSRRDVMARKRRAEAKKKARPSGDAPSNKT